MKFKIQKHSPINKNIISTIISLSRKNKKRETIIYKFLSNSLSIIY